MARRRRPLQIAVLSDPGRIGHEIAAALKKTLNQKRLAYPKVTRRAAAGRAQRHVPDSIATLRYLIAREIATTLARCPRCTVLRRDNS